MARRLRDAKAATEASRSPRRDEERHGDALTVSGIRLVSSGRVSVDKRRHVDGVGANSRSVASPLDSHEQPSNVVLIGRQEALSVNTPAMGTGAITILMDKSVSGSVATTEYPVRQRTSRWPRRGQTAR